MKAIYVMLGIASLLLAASPAVAGMAFAESFDTHPGDASFNPPTTTVTHTPGGSFDPPGILTFSGTMPVVNVGRFDAIFAEPRRLGGAEGGSNDLILYFGSIIGTPILTNVGVSEDGTTFHTQPFFLPFSTSNANLGVTLDASYIPLGFRDEVMTVRFEFAFDGATTFQIDAVATPEPATFALFGLGLLGLGGAAYRRRKIARSKKM